MEIPSSEPAHGKSPLQQLHEFLSGEGMNHDWWVRMLIKYGEAFEPSELPPDVPVMPPRCCYLNSFTLATEQPKRFTYFEGYAVLTNADGWGVPHAWCVDRRGRVVDSTWANVRSDRPGGYIGIRIPLQVIEPYAYQGSRGTIDGWRREHCDVMGIELPVLLGVEPI